MEDEIGREIMKKFVGLRGKTYSYLKDNNDEDTKVKRCKKVVHKKKTLNLKITKAVQKQLSWRIK